MANFIIAVALFICLALPVGCWGASFLYAEQTSYALADDAFISSAVATVASFFGVAFLYMITNS